jgi:hypothetical protein
MVIAMRDVGAEMVLFDPFEDEWWTRFGVDVVYYPNWWA